MHDRQHVRWGLVGTARINERLIPCLERSPRSELRAVASRQQETANTFAAAWNIPHAYGNYETLLNDADIDAVYISLPNHLHAEWAVKFADAGKHVLCEKPLALTTEQVERMMDAAQRNNVIIQEAAMMRFHPQIEFVRDLIAQGTIGEIRLARGLFTFCSNVRKTFDGIPKWAAARSGIWAVIVCAGFARYLRQNRMK